MYTHHQQTTLGTHEATYPHIVLLQKLQACKERNWTSIECKECGKACRNTHGLLGHMEATGHDGGVAQCDACGRIKVT
jgi:hypothetical protein